MKGTLPEITKAALALSDDERLPVNSSLGTSAVIEVRWPSIVASPLALSVS